MGCLFILLLVGLLAWANLAVVQMFTRRQAKARWWIGLAVAGGAGLGIWSGFFLEYQILPTLRVIGFPVPAAFFHLEGPPGQEQWIDFVTPDPLLVAGSNILILGMLAACPVWLAFWLWRGHSDWKGHSRTTI
jgi:hypothetical protein